MKIFNRRSLPPFAAGLPLALVPFLLPLLVPVGSAWGHGAKLDYRLAPSVEVQAQYDNGEPMAEAQVAVFAPGQPEQPWRTGVTDTAGRFRFSPDGDQPGPWEVQVRQAGHGGVIAIPLGGEEVAPAPPPVGGTGYSPAQIGLMVALGLWGCLGTGLFFARRAGPGAPGPDSPAAPPASQDASATALANPHAHS